MIDIEYQSTSFVRRLINLLLFIPRYLLTDSARL